VYIGENMYDNIDQIINFIKSNDNFLVTAHINADGDAFASMLAMAYVLEKWEKKNQVVIHDGSVDEKYHYMWGSDKIQSYSDHTNSNYKAAIVLDVPSRKRIGDPANLLPEPLKCIKIDHHPVEEEFAHLNIVDTNASSTSQILFEIIEHTGIPVTSDLATLFFSGIMYDTGRFSFSNTRERDFEIASKLLKSGALPNVIANNLFFNNSFSSLKTIGYALANMESFFEGKLSLIFIPLEIMEANVQAEIEELANYSVAIKGVEVGLFIREVKPEFFKMSFRSKGNVDVNIIAKTLGGGGHMHAAGARYSGNFNDLKEKLQKAVSQSL
jgi:phosphoesterase RecJ-like protein